MNKTAICFTSNGIEVIKKIKYECEKTGIKAPKAYVLMAEYKDDGEGFDKVNVTLNEWTKEHFTSGNALIFVGAMGIAVRAIAPFVRDKLVDCPVVVIDDKGQFVIPVLSGHVGGANKLSMTLSKLIGAVPVITTSTDAEGVFSVDQYATENRFIIANRDGIKKVSAKALEDKKITLSIKDYPPKEKVDVLVADDTDAEYSLLLKPKKYTVGIGMKKGKDRAAAEEFFLETLKKLELDVSDIYAFCTIDIKEDEEALIFLRDKYRIPLLTFDSKLLGKAEGEFSSSDFVKKTVGVGNVCERAAVLGAGAGSSLVMKKTANEGMTIAVAKRNIFVSRI
ncbi:MAG: cobalamin biosynthesis protein [Butyrivibrio sp.]|uniref:cobalt-precorrin 5A hydrolase n=1 Tax=Butyrivibrio sp. TaxID=28121 RepID=UPI001B0CB1D2|nr:cobalamin biosynthesis protein [Butyrivibrio sp.]MBO6239632.1 cobalamin biosynthesis protein [Butyrivibrio sp.]